MNNEQKVIWFKAKRYGWGWYPVTWQGWMSTGIYLILLLREIAYSSLTTTSQNEMFISFALPFVFITALFLFLTWGTGEKPHWSWGNKKVL